MLNDYLVIVNIYKPNLHFIVLVSAKILFEMATVTQEPFMIDETMTTFYITDCKVIVCALDMNKN